MMTTAYRMAMVVMLLVWVVAGPTSEVLADDSPCYGCGVTSGPGSESYRGALLLPPGSDAGLAKTAAQCDGCEWHLQPDCRDTAGTGDVICPGAFGTCPPGRIRVELSLRRPGWPVFQIVGTFCRGPGQALTPEALVPGVRDQFVKYLPAMRPSFQPAGRGIVNIPVLFAAGQPETIGRPAFALGGFRVELEARASWRWDFGDGASPDRSRVVI